jgi:uncharacterized protein
LNDGQLLPEAQPPASSEPTTEPPADEIASPERYPFWSYTDVGLFFAFAVPALLIGWLAVEGFFAVLGLHLEPRAVEPLAQQLVGYVILFAALMLQFRVQYDRPFWQSLAWRPMRMPLGWVVTCGLLAAFAVSLIGYLIRTPNTENTITELMRDRVSLVLMVIFGTTFGPVCEELAFRGFLQPILVRSVGPVLGILTTALPFGLLHYREYGNSWRHVVILSASGAAFGWMRHKTGSTKAAALMHASFNALAFAAVIAQRTIG